MMHNPYFFQSKSDVYKSPREPLKDENANTTSDPMFGMMGSKPTNQSPVPGIVYLPGCGQIVRTLPNWKAPEGVLSKGIYIESTP